MGTEICGDVPLTLKERLRYVVQNTWRNLSSDARIRPRPFHSAPVEHTSAPSSPGRVLSEAFIHHQLPVMLPKGRIRVLEIGCGSGKLPVLLTAAGYSGRYVGIDVVDRWRPDVDGAFERHFMRTDAHTFSTEEQFDLVVSISVLEHVADDERVIKRLSGLVAPGGLQLHIVPSAWGLPVYLWHGYRQYTTDAVARRFEPSTVELFALGGPFSFAYYLAVATVAETVLRLRLRRRWPQWYRRMLTRALAWDRIGSVGATMFAICMPRPVTPE